MWPAYTPHHFFISLLNGTWSWVADSSTDYTPKLNCVLLCTSNAHFRTHKTHRRLYAETLDLFLFWLPLRSHLLNCVFLWGCPTKKILYVFLSSVMHVTYFTRLKFLYANDILKPRKKLQTVKLVKIQPLLLRRRYLCSNTLLSTAFSNNHNLCSFVTLSFTSVSSLSPQEESNLKEAFNKKCLG